MLAGYLVVSCSGIIILALANFIASFGSKIGMGSTAITAGYVSVVVLFVLVSLYLVVTLSRGQAVGVQQLVDRLCKWARSRLGASAIMLFALFAVVGVQAFEWSSRIIMHGSLRSEMSSMNFFYYNTYYFRLVGAVLLPLMLLALMLWIGRRNRKLAGSAD